MPANPDPKALTADYLELTAELKNLPRGMAFVGDRARHLGFSPKRINEVELVVEEALVNVIEHAYPDQPGLLRLDLKTATTADLEEELHLEIRDRGTEFNPLKLASPDLAADLMERPIGGLGIFLMQELSDKLDWQRDNEENCLTIIFAPRQASDHA
ncbi:MAG: ATP-binding protein [Deltaproteobacteria bacterium]|nr:ATP-binding protein [Deltaproteobacteria bacterium]